MGYVSISGWVGTLHVFSGGFGSEVARGEYDGLVCEKHGDQQLGSGAEVVSGFGGNL